MNNISWGDSLKSKDSGERTLYWVKKESRNPIEGSEVMLTTTTGFENKAVYINSCYYKETLNGNILIDNVVAWMYYPIIFKE